MVCPRTSHSKSGDQSSVAIRRHRNDVTNRRSPPSMHVHRRVVHTCDEIDYKGCIVCHYTEGPRERSQGALNGWKTQRVEGGAARDGDDRMHVEKSTRAKLLPTCKPSLARGVAG